MSNFVAVGDGEVLVAEFLVSESLLDTFGDLGEGISVGSFDIDLLNLSRAGDAIKRGGIHNQGVVKINVVEIDGAVDFVKNADDHEFFTHDGNHLADSTIDSIKESERKGVTENNRVGFVLSGEEGAVAEGKRLNFNKVGVGAEDGDRGKGVFLGSDSVGRNSNGSYGGDAFDIRDSLDVGESEAGFLEGISGGEFLNNIRESILSGARTNDDKVGTDFGDLVFDEVRNTTHKGKN